MSPSRSASPSARPRSSRRCSVAEFRVAEDALLDVGSHISADHFVPGQLVDIAGVTQGKGFAGAMKRWGFRGLRATHGVSVSHRSHGSTGNRQDPGRVFKNKKMAGHMGARNRTQQNLEVVRTDPIRGLLFIKGSVPGHKGSWLTVRTRSSCRAPTPRPIRPGSSRQMKAEEVEVPAAGLVDEAAVHEMPALPSDEEVAAIAAEQEAGSRRGGASAAEAAELKRGCRSRQKPRKPRGRGQSIRRAPEADESKES